MSVLRTALVAIIALPITSSSVFAEWSWIGTNNNFSLFVDEDTVRRQGNNALIWVLTEDFSEYIECIGQGNLDDCYQSTRSLYELDCSTERMRILQTSFHSEPEAAGEVIRTLQSPSGWQYIAPQTFGSEIYRVACE